jgi:hypothetical protein
MLDVEADRVATRVTIFLPSENSNIWLMQEYGIAFAAKFRRMVDLLLGNVDAALLPDEMRSTSILWNAYRGWISLSYLILIIPQRFAYVLIDSGEIVQVLSKYTYDDRIYL